MCLSRDKLFLASVAALITNEFFSKLKLRYRKLKDSKKNIAIFYEKILIGSVVDKTNRKKSRESS